MDKKNCKFEIALFSPLKGPKEVSGGFMSYTLAQLFTKGYCLALW